MTEEEQAIECYQIWMDFKAQIDAQLETFIQSQPEGLTNEIIMESLHRMNEVTPEFFLTCFSYLTAAADYEEFVQLMLEHQEIVNFSEVEAYDPALACQQYQSDGDDNCQEEEEKKE